MNEEEKQALSGHIITMVNELLEKDFSRRDQWATNVAKTFTQSVADKGLSKLQIVLLQTLSSVLTGVSLAVALYLFK